MSERVVHTPPESQGDAPARGRLTGRRVLVVGGGQMEIGEADTPIGNGRAMASCSRARAQASPWPTAIGESAEATVSLSRRKAARPSPSRPM